MRQITFPVGPLACNCTILGDDASAFAWVIDPGADVAGIVSHLEGKRWKLSGILITHAHIDHIGGAAELSRMTGAPVWYSPRDLGLVDMLDFQAHWLGVEPPEHPALDAELNANAELRLGPHRLHVLETPGHTEGSVCLYLPEEHKLFAGDTLFAGSVGRTDLPGGNWDALQRSLRGTVMMLPDETIVIPGHGPETTIGRERDSNPFLR